MPFFDKFRAPDRFLIVFIFGVALLAGFGADRIISKDENEENGTKKAKKKKRKNEVSPPSRIHVIAILILIVIVIIGILQWLGGPGKIMFDGIMSTTIAGPLGITIDESNFAQYEKWRSAFPMVILYFAVFAAFIPLSNLMFGRVAGGRGAGLR